MSIEHILKRIEEDTNAAVEEALVEGRAEADLIAQDYAKRAAQLRGEMGERARRHAEEEEHRLVVSEQLELRKKTLESKRRVLEELYQAALERIESLPEDEYLDIIRGLILARAVSGREEIVVPAAQRELFSGKFLARLGKERSGSAFTLAAEPGDFTWGVVLREGRRVVDLTLPVFFEQVKERIEPEIASILFPGA